MTEASSTEARLAAVKEYYRKVGMGDASFLELFTDDFDFHYYKFGIGKGKADFAEFHRRGAKLIKSVAFNIDQFRYTIGADDIVVEGTEFGVSRSGKPFPDHEVSEGRFCSVFTFEGALIKRMFMYADPDLGSEDAERVRVFFRPK